MLPCVLPCRSEKVMRWGGGKGIGGDGLEEAVNAPRGQMALNSCPLSCVERDDLVSISFADEVAWCGYRSGPIRPRQQTIQHHTTIVPALSHAGSRFAFQRLFRTGPSQCLAAKQGCTLLARESRFPADGDRKTPLFPAFSPSTHVTIHARPPSSHWAASRYFISRFHAQTTRSRIAETFQPSRKPRVEPPWTSASRNSHQLEAFHNGCDQCPRRRASVH